MGENAVRAAACGVTVLVLWAVLGGVVADDDDRSAFEWWSQIWIPLGVGAATVLVSAVALIASSRATLLAHEVERQREAAAAERADDEQRHRLQSMAVGEARALMAWCIAASKRWSWEHQKLEEVGPDLHGPTLRDRAQAIMSQSLVPGADVLLELTTAEIGGMWRHLPDPVYMPDASYTAHSAHADSAMLREVTPWRVARMTRRIRAWSHDPVGSLPDLIVERDTLRSDPAHFFDYRLAVELQGLRPLAQLPKPPQMHAERVEWLRANGFDAPILRQTETENQQGRS